MKSLVWHFAALIALSLAVGNAQAAVQYYNVDSETLPNGPIELTNRAQMATATGWILSGDALDTGSQSYSDVKFVGEWMFDASTAFSYQGGGFWSSSNGNTWQTAAPDGFIVAGNISPVPSSWTSASFPSDPPAFVAPANLLPYVNIGTLNPGVPVHFSTTINANPNYNFEFVSSFVSTTPVPEPSSMTLVALALAVAAICLARARRVATKN